MSKLTEQELRDAIERRKEAQANNACEGIFLSEEEERLFEYMEEQHLSHDARHKLIDDYFHGRLNPLPWLK